MFSYLRARARAISFKMIKPRHYAVLLLIVFLVVFCLLIVSSTTTTARNFHLLQITFNSGDAKSGVYYADALTELKADIGYFATCIQTNFLNNVNEWNCGTNETHLLLTDTNFLASLNANLDLLNLYIQTAAEFRKYCLTPYAIVAALACGFFALMLFAFTSPLSSPGMYKYGAIVTFLAFAISLVAAVWQETNILTATHLFKSVVDSYYGISVHYNIASRVLVWMGVGFSLLATGTLVVLATLSTLFRDITEEVLDEEKM